MIELLRVDFRIVGLHRDENGGITGESVVGEGTAHAAGLDDLPRGIRDAVEKANAETPAEE